MRFVPRVLAWFALASILLVVVDAAAQDKRNRYKWKDEGGSVHIEDSIPPEAARLGYEMVNDQGMVIRRVQRAKTAEELAADKADAQARAAEKRHAADVASRDAQMMAAYPTEDDLRRAQDSQLAIITQNIETATAGAKAQERSLADLLTHAAELERSNTAVPAKIQQQIATLRKSIAEQNAFLLKRQNDRQTTEKEFAADLLHYREVKERVQSEKDGSIATQH
jgi:hypothetical protein